jgi:hypothetical protein
LIPLYKSSAAYKNLKSNYNSQASGNVTLQPEAPLDYLLLTENNFDMEIEKGFASMEAGRVISSDVVRSILKRKYA